MIYISSVNNAAYPLATKSRDGPTGLHASIYVYKICCVRRWRWRRTCRRPWAARRPIKTRRAGRAQRKSGAAVMTIKWPRATIDIGIYAVRPPPYIATVSRPPVAIPRDRFRQLIRPRVTHLYRMYSVGPLKNRIPYTIYFPCCSVYYLRYKCMCRYK